MQKSFTLGAVAGVSTLLLAVPFVAQIAGAQSASSVATSSPPVPSQACVQTMVGLEDAHLANIDAMMASKKQSMQTRRDALAAVAAITDDAQRQEALKRMHEDMRANMKTSMTQPEAVATAMEAVKAACGDSLGFRGGFHKGFGMGHMMGKRGGKHHGWMKPSQESSTSVQQ